MAFRLSCSSRLLEFAPAMGGAVFLGFYSFLFGSFNAADPFRVPATQGHLDAFAYSLDRCARSTSKISVAGWVAKPGVHRATHTTTVLIRDESDGRLFAMKTDLPNRKDVTVHLNRMLGDDVDYDNTGFSASLNLHKARRGIKQGRVYIAFDENGQYTLLPMPCTYSALP
jgi:hypothetical protein